MARSARKSTTPADVAEPTEVVDPAEPVEAVPDDTPAEVVHEPVEATAAEAPPVFVPVQDGHYVASADFTAQLGYSLVSFKSGDLIDSLAGAELHQSGAPVDVVKD